MTTNNGNSQPPTVHNSPYTVRTNLTALTLPELRDKRIRKEKKKRKRADILEHAGWKVVPKGKYHFYTPLVDSPNAFLSLNLPRHVRKVDIFTRIYTPSLVQAIIQRLQVTPSALVRQDNSSFELNTSIAYRYLAHYIRICALQNKPKRIQRKPKPMRAALKEAQEFFINTATASQLLGIDMLERFVGQFWIRTTEEVGILNQNIQRLVESLGEWLAGDEKLFKFTGNSGFIRKCPNKPDKIGLWVYELTGRLANGKPFLIYLRVHDAVKAMDEHIPCKEIMEEWATIIATSSTPLSTILVADSYYLDNGGRDILQRLKVPYICGVQASRFQNPAHFLRSRVRKPGHWEAVWNKEKEEIFVHA